jgi:putative nucleotidyltransferase with HDIG domain
MNKINIIGDLFFKYGDITYGEKMSVISHSVQSALIAQEKGFPREMVVAAFLHDIGHMIPPSDLPSESMDGFGAIDHETLGAHFLQQLGFEDVITVPVKNHVQSKRYLCTIHKNYYDSLSLASQKTMEFQGGLLSTSEVAQFEADPYFRQSIELRLLDDEAKEENYDVKDSQVDYLLSLCSEVLLK